MKINEAIWYLTPIRDSASLERYRDAMTTAIDALNYQLRHEQPKTIGDRIRAMTDEELAAELYRIQGFGQEIGFCQNRQECKDSLDRDEEIPDERRICCMLEYIRQPAKED